uniref:Golgi apparatus membrane protein TVP23 homolog n=1 Tax=Globisporangium ultimum (strain ATCC 200006 / CBS 805.95 / DAOM BR144) TaxID=431595 RepID=K3WNX7_GLOUD
MMSEEKKAANLEFITVEAVDVEGVAADTATTASASTKKSKAKTEDGEALLSSMRKTVTNAKHPVAAFFHLFFKGLALFVYLFGGVLFSSYVFIFVVCILLLAFDFWTVKNVTGRLLVGLRWWNRINEDGTNEWIFESHEDMTEIDALDSQVFWGGLYGTPMVWVFLLIIAVLKFNVQWALIVVIAVMLSSANIIGYTKCKKDAKQKMHSLMSQGALGALSTSAGSSLMSTIGGFALGGVASSREKKQQPVTV